MTTNSVHQDPYNLSSNKCFDSFNKSSIACSTAPAVRVPFHLPEAKEPEQPRVSASMNGSKSESVQNGRQTATTDSEPDTDDEDNF